jgi:hypothetical protein
MWQNYNIASYFRPFAASAREYTRATRLNTLYEKYRVLECRMKISIVNKITNIPFMFCVVNTGLDALTPGGPSIDHFEQSGMVYKKMIGSSYSGTSGKEVSISFNVPNLLRKEVDPIHSKISTVIGTNPAALQSIYVALIAQDMTSPAAIIGCSYMVTLDAVVELTDLIEQ